MVGWKVQASHFIVAALGNHTSSHTLFQNGPLKRRAGIKECKRMADAGSITNFMVGWKVEASHFIVAALGNHTSSHTLFQNSPLRGQGLHLEALEAKSRNTKGWQMLALSPISWWVEGLRTSSPHYSKIAHWKARVGTGRHWKQKWRNGKIKMKEWQNGLILSEVLKSVDLRLDHL